MDKLGYESKMKWGGLPQIDGARESLIRQNRESRRKTGWEREIGWEREKELRKSDEDRVI